MMCRYAGEEHGNIQMVRNNSLVIKKSNVDNTGHYLCTGVNSAGKPKINLI